MKVTVRVTVMCVNCRDMRWIVATAKGEPCAEHPDQFHFNPDDLDGHPLGEYLCGVWAGEHVGPIGIVDYDLLRVE